MTWFVLSVLLFTDPRINKVDAELLNCPDPPQAVSIVINGDDNRTHQLTVTGSHAGDKFTELIRVDKTTTASLRLRGHRTDCQKFSPDSGDTLLFAFSCDELPAVDVIVTVDAGVLDVAYERRLGHRTATSCDCIEKGTIARQRTILDVGLDDEHVIVQFGTRVEGAPGLDVHREVRKFALRGIPKTTRSGEQVKRGLAAQRAKVTGYLAPIALDIDEKRLKPLTKMTIEVEVEK